MTKTRSGMVAIMVTTIIMIVMSLITLGFARIVQREQRQGLDNQLSTQAFYAAESGINMVAAQLAGPNRPTQSKTNCDVAAYNDGIITPGNNDVRISCLMYELSPEELVYSNGTITAERSRVVPINAEPKPSVLNISWQDGTGGGNNTLLSGCNFSSPPVLPTVGAWTAAKRMGMLQIDLMPIHSGSSTPQNNRQILNDETFTVILYPCSGGVASNISYSDYIGNNYTSRRGSVVAANCTGTGVDATCNASIDLRTNPGDSSTDFYYARLKSIYSSVNVKINGRAPSGQSVRFADAQVVVDSTGRVNDVLRRLQVRLSLSPDYNIPEASIQSQNGVCKLLTVTSSTGNGAVQDNCF